MVTKESFISICWRLIPYWLNNWEQQWGAECSSMMFELPHFAVELLLVLPCVQVSARCRGGRAAFGWVCAWAGAGVRHAAQQELVAAMLLGLVALDMNSVQSVLDQRRRACMPGGGVAARSRPPAAHTHISQPLTLLKRTVLLSRATRPGNVSATRVAW